uniref:Uncharacterized protein n=1 Tax=Phlebotomus kandelakii TaxID=1109342 RepID=A0A6B2EJI4_9DIPT
MHPLWNLIRMSALWNLIGMLRLVGSLWSRIVSLWHVGMRRQMSLSHQPLNLLLTPPFELQILLMRVLLLIIHCIPSLIPPELLPTRLIQKFSITDEFILVDVRLLEHVLSHPLHLLSALLHVILRRSRLINLVQLLHEQRLHLQLIPHTVSVQIVHHEEGLRIEILSLHVILFLPNLLQLRLSTRMMHLVMLIMLLLHLLEILLILLPMILIHRLHAFLLLELLLHFVPFKLVPSQFIRFRQVISRLVDQLLEILHLKSVLIRVIEMLRDLQVFPINIICHFKLLNRQLTQSLEFCSFDFIKFRANAMIHIFQLVSDLSTLNVHFVNTVEFLPEVRIALQGAHHLLQVVLIFEDILNIGSRVIWIVLLLVAGLLHFWRLLLLLLSLLIGRHRKPRSAPNHHGDNHRKNPPLHHSHGSSASLSSV